MAQLQINTSIVICSFVSQQYFVIFRSVVMVTIQVFCIRNPQYVLVMNMQQFKVTL